MVAGQEIGLRLLCEAFQRDIRPAEGLQEALRVLQLVMRIRVLGQVRARNNLWQLQVHRWPVPMLHLKPLAH